MSVSLVREKYRGNLKHKNRAADISDKYGLVSFGTIFEEVGVKIRASKTVGDWLTLKIVKQLDINLHLKPRKVFKQAAYIMRTNLLNWCNLVSISKYFVFYAFLVVRVY